MKAIGLAIIILSINSYLPIQQYPDLNTIFSGFVLGLGLSIIGRE